MNIKRDKFTLLVFFLLLTFLSGLFVGCTREDRYADAEKEGKYRGTSEHLKGYYMIEFPEENHFETGAKESVLNGKDAKGKRRPSVHMDVKIQPKDGKTLEVQYQPYGEPSEKTFTMKYDEKTGKAKGKDADGYEWEIQFESEKVAKYAPTSLGGHVYDSSTRYVEMSYIKREKSGALGMGKEIMEGYSSLSNAQYVFEDEAEIEKERKKSEKIQKELEEERKYRLWW